MKKFFQKEIDAFSHAASYDRVDTLRKMIREFGPAIMGYLDSGGSSPLNRAAQGYHLSLGNYFGPAANAIEFLLEYGARTNTIDKEGYTPEKHIRKAINDYERSMSNARTPDDFTIDSRLHKKAEKVLELFLKQSLIPPEERLAARLKKDAEEIENVALVKSIPAATRIRVRPKRLSSPLSKMLP